MRRFSGKQNAQSHKLKKNLHGSDHYKKINKFRKFSISIVVTAGVTCLRVVIFWKRRKE